MLVNKEKDIVQCAAVLACELHKGQVDKAGVDYFTGHLTTVAKMGSTWKEQVVGYLHDASEDTPHSVEEVLNLLDAKLPPKVLGLQACATVPARFPPH